MKAKFNDTVSAISLSLVKYGDTSLIANCYTLEFGLQGYMLKGILSKGKKNISKSLFEPLTLLELQTSKNLENRLSYIKEAKIDYAFNSIPYDLTKKALVFFIAEVIHQVAREEREPNPMLYHFIKKKLIWLDKNDTTGLFHLKMMLDITQFIGFYPNLLNSEAPYFDLEAGCMSFVKPKAYFIEEPLKRYWVLLLGTDFDKIGEIRIFKKHKLELLNHLITYFELHLQQFKSPKSSEILNEIFKMS